MLQASAAGRSGRLTQSFEDGIGRPTPNAINDLKRRELQRTADRISARSGLHHANPIEGEKFSGTYKQFINLASGKYAIIENAKEFVLVPWKPGLEDMRMFGRPDMSSSCECERSQDASLAQSLHLLNAKDIQEKLARDGGRAAVLAEDSTRSDEEKVRSLYLLAFAREPNAAEISTAQSHIDKTVKARGGDKEIPAKRQAYEDIVWALLNTKEFLFNH